MRAVLSFAYLAKYFVFFIEWLHSKHLVINLFKFSLGERRPFFRKIDWFHIAPRPHIADAAPVCSRILSRSRYIRRRRRLQLLDRTLHQQLA